MRRHGFSYRKLASIRGKADTEKQKQFLEERLNSAIEKAEKGEIELSFCDAAHFTLSAFLCMVRSQAGTLLRTFHGRNRINVSGAVHAISKDVTTLINTICITGETVVPCPVERKIINKLFLGFLFFLIPRYSLFFI